MSKTIHTPCTELVCGKLDLVGEELQHLGQFKSTQAAAIRLLDLAGDIQHDCERMEAKLIIRKDESEEAATKYAAVCQELEEAQREISDWETSMESVTGCDSIGEASNAILELKDDNKEQALEYIALSGQMQTYLEALPKVKADAIREALRSIIDKWEVTKFHASVLGDDGYIYISNRALDEYADKLEAES